MRIYGLTGNIGSGKSTVARLLRERGVPVVDADEAAREVVLPGRPALAELAARFPGVLTAEGTLDRRALAARAFADPAERAALNAIVHPRIAEEVAKKLDELRESGAPFAIYEAALIIENQLDLGLDGLLVVTAPEDAQVRRVLLRDGLAEAETRARLAAQLPASVKAARADFVIDNSGVIESLGAQVDGVLAALRAGYARDRSKP